MIFNICEVRGILHNLDSEKKNKKCTTKEIYIDPVNKNMVKYECFFWWHFWCLSSKRSSSFNSL